MKYDWKADKSQLQSRLARAAGQLRAIEGMVEAEDDCERVAQQLAAVRKALDRAFYDLVSSALKREILDGDASAKKTGKQIEELSDLLKRYG